MKTQPHSYKEAGPDMAKSPDMHGWETRPFVTEALHQPPTCKGGALCHYQRFLCRLCSVSPGTKLREASGKPVIDISAHVSPHRRSQTGRCEGLFKEKEWEASESPHGSLSSGLGMQVWNKLVFLGIGLEQ